MESFTFELNQEVRVRNSNLLGIILGRAEYVTSPRSYLVEVTSNIMPTTTWYIAEALEAI